MGSKFRFPTGDGKQRIYNTVNDAVRGNSELAASISNSLRPLIPRVWSKTYTIGRVTANTGSSGAWRSPIYTIADLPGYSDIFATFSAFGSNDDNLHAVNCMWILVNGRTVEESTGIYSYNPMNDVPISVSISLNVLPGDTMQLVIAPTNGDPGTNAVTNNVRISLHAQYTNPILIS